MNTDALYAAHNTCRRGKKRSCGSYCGRGRTPANCRARGAALLVCIFVMLMISSLVVFALDIQTTEMALARNTLDLSKALYLADGGLQHALGMLRADRTWRTGFPSPGVEYPAGSGNFYVVTVVDGGGGEVIVTSTGSSSGLSKTVRATIALP